MIITASLRPNVIPVDVNWGHISKLTHSVCWALVTLPSHSFITH